MDTKTIELIAIGAAVTANCVTWLRHHVNAAREAGVEEVEIREAIRVGRMVRQGASATLDKEATSLLKEEGDW